MEGDALLEAAELAKKWNEIGVWREDALNYDGDTREELYAGLSGADQHHTQTFVNDIVHNMNEKQPGSDPKFFYWGEENGNFFKDIFTHGAMAVSANSKHPEKALQVYDLIRNDKEDYDALQLRHRGRRLRHHRRWQAGLPRGLRLLDHGRSAPTTGGAAWTSSSCRRTTQAPNKDELIAELNATAKDYPYSTLHDQQDSIDPTLAAMARRAVRVHPAAAYGKFDDPAAAIAEMRQKLKDVGYEDARASIQADMDAWATERGLK